eukprot:249832-Chlamydomonas_euryale.AAC.3
MQAAGWHHPMAPSLPVTAVSSTGGSPTASAPLGPPAAAATNGRSSPENASTGASGTVPPDNPGTDET